MKKNILSVVLSALVVFYLGTASAAEKVKTETSPAVLEFSNAPIQRSAEPTTEEMVSPAIERFSIAESVDEIITPDTEEPAIPDSIPEVTPDKYSESDLYWLSRIIEAEASGESQAGKIAVGNCVINRVNSKEFPNTIYGVIFDTKYGVQYQPTANGAIYNNPSDASVQAAKDALNGHSVVGNALYFCSVKVAPYSWASKNRPYLTTIGNHVFYL